jgi:hypothetical protein
MDSEDNADHTWHEQASRRADVADWAALVPPRDRAHEGDTDRDERVMEVALRLDAERTVVRRRVPRGESLARSATRKA